MVHRPSALAQVEHGCQCAGDVILGALHCRAQILAAGQLRRNRAGERTARAVGIGVVNALAVEPLRFAVPIEQVVGIV